MKKNKKKKSAKHEPHPTLFILEGSIRHFEAGSMLELHMQITEDEWKEIVVGTIQYKIFLECLKEVAFPILVEEWTAEDDWHRLMLEVNISRMRNIDPIYVATINQAEIREAFENKIRTNALQVAEEIKQFRDQHVTWLGKNTNHDRIDVSGL